jgi:hypothetical protein
MRRSFFFLLCLLFAAGTLHPGDTEMTTVAADGLPGGGEALNISVQAAANPDYGMQLSQTVPTALADQSVLRLHFWGRSQTHLQT